MHGGLMPISAKWWVGFNLGVVALLGLDMLWRRRGGLEMSFKLALHWSVFWILLSVAFGTGITLGVIGGYPVEERGAAGLQFFTAYLLEKSLSLDNIFVFVLLFRHFQVPAAQQRGVLTGGVLGAMVLRAVLILGGVALARKFEWIFYIFGAYLLWAAWRMWRQIESPRAPGRHRIWDWLKRVLPATEENPEGRLIVRRDGRWLITSLFAVLVTVELADALFAFDSVPAVLAVTRDPFIAFTSNILAVLGLRALFFVLQHVIARCHLLHYGLALLLGFIGLKMLLAKVYDVPLSASLAVMAVILAGSIFGSMLLPRKNPPSPNLR
ncbi:MAG TPA: TerC/Alx family metal homeostasis membrane protein [Opitutales bacterium]|nr:TerC/Alx family metal homeostasis membrane protein [Opitutales bacterium]